MGLELFNKTTRIKELPKYNYNGKFRLGPNSTYPIKDYMVPFYKPFERIGVIVRHLPDEEVAIEEEVKKVLDEVRKEEPAKSDPVVTETVNVGQPKVEKVEVVKEVEQPVATDTVKVNEEAPVEEKKESAKYTEEELNETKMDELKNILINMGIDPQTIKYKKTEYVKAILEAQK